MVRQPQNHTSRDDCEKFNEIKECGTTAFRPAEFHSMSEFYEVARSAMPLADIHDMCGQWSMKDGDSPLYDQAVRGVHPEFIRMLRANLYLQFTEIAKLVAAETADASEKVKAEFEKGFLKFVAGTEIIFERSIRDLNSSLRAFKLFKSSNVIDDNTKSELSSVIIWCRDKASVSGSGPNNHQDNFQRVSDKFQDSCVLDEPLAVSCDEKLDVINSLFMLVHSMHADFADAEDVAVFRKKEIISLAMIKDSIDNSLEAAKTDPDTLNFITEYIKNSLKLNEVRLCGISCRLLSHWDSDSNIEELAKIKRLKEEYNSSDDRKSLLYEQTLLHEDTDKAVLSYFNYLTERIERTYGFISQYQKLRALL